MSVTEGSDPIVGASGFDPVSARHRSPSNARRMLRRLLRNRGAVAALVYLSSLLLVAVLAPWIMPHDPNAQSLGNSLQPPLSEGHLLGTDEFGRDVLSRLIDASRVALQASVQAVTIGLIIGLPLGLLAGYLGGWVDVIIMRISDTLQSFPLLLFAIAVVAALGPGVRNAMFAVGVVFSPQFLRVIRASVLEVREEAFIEASRSIGTPTGMILRRRVLPNILPALLVIVSLAAGFALLAEAGLSFLGLGVQLPDASWGLMLGRGYDYVQAQPWLIVFPGTAIALTVLAFNVLGDGLRDSIGKEERRDR